MRKRAGLMNTAYQSAADRSSSIRFIETWSLFADDDGRYTKYLTDAGGQLRVARVGDGIHLSRAGTRKLVRELGDVFEEEWNLAVGRRRGLESPCRSLR